jgi:hypothetical protein
MIDTMLPDVLRQKYPLPLCEHVPFILQFPLSPNLHLK